MKWPSEKQEPATKEAGQEEREAFHRINVDAARQLIDSGQVQLIDVREPGEYKTGHIPGARLVPLNTLLRQPREFLTRDNLVFVCAVGERSAVACEMAVALGLSNVYNVQGGTKDWIARGYPVEK